MPESSRAGLEEVDGGAVWCYTNRRRAMRMRGSEWVLSDVDCEL
jgi:hypothetical protein